MKGMGEPVSIRDVSAARRARQLLSRMTAAAEVEGGKRSEGYGEGLEWGGTGGEGNGAHSAVGTRDYGRQRGQQPAVVAGDVGMGGEDPVFAIGVRVAGGAARGFGHVFEAVGAAGGAGGTGGVDTLLHVAASVVVAFVGRHGGPVVLSALLALGALGVYLLSSPDGDPADS